MYFNTVMNRINSPHENPNESEEWTIHSDKIGIIDIRPVIQNLCVTNFSSIIEKLYQIR